MFEKRVSQSERLYETNHVTSRHGRNTDRFRDHGIGPIIVEAAKVSVCASASSSVARMQPEKTSVLVPRLSRTKLFGRDDVRGVITEAVQALGYRLPTREQLLVTEQFVSGRDVLVSLPTGSGKSVCYGCLPLDGSASKKSVAGGTVCACVRAHKGRTGIRNETAYWSLDNHALRHSMFAQKNQETLRKRPARLSFRAGARESLGSRLHP